MERERVGKLIGLAAEKGNAVIGKNFYKIIALH